MTQEISQQTLGSNMIASFFITLLVYGIFPFAYSQQVKKTITRGKYCLICFAVNFPVMIGFAVIAIMSKLQASATPYFVWTIIFSSLGIRILIDRGLLEAFPKEGDKWKTILKRSRVDTSEMNACDDTFEYSDITYSKSKCMQAIYDVYISVQPMSTSLKMLKGLISKRNGKYFSIFDQLCIDAILKYYPEMSKEITEDIPDTTDRAIAENHPDTPLLEEPEQADAEDQPTSEENYSFVPVFVEDATAKEAPLPAVATAEAPARCEKPRKRRNVKMLICIILIPVLIAAGGIGSYYSYEHGYNSGYGNGHKEGYYSGYNDGRDVGYNCGYLAGYNKISEEYEFFHNAAVIVTTTGSKYHHYNCHYVKNSDIYIYNVENAKYKGYTPCSVCFK